LWVAANIRVLDRSTSRIGDPMLNAPALIVRHRRFTLVIGVLLTCLMAIATIAVSIELYRAEAALAIVLAPQIFVVIAAAMLKLAYDRWATSMVCLSISPQGLLLPGMSERRIPWIDVRSVRSISSTPTLEHATKPCQYLLFEVEVPAVSRNRPGLLWWRPQVLVLDVSRLDTRKDVVLEAVYRYNPAAVADAEVGRTKAAAARPDAARLRLPMAATIGFYAQCIRVETAALRADCGELWSGAVATWHRLTPLVRREARTLTLGAIALQRNTVWHAQRLVLALRDMTMTNLARGHRTVREAAVVIRHRFVRSV
jgi:hypothetical protein